MSSEAAPSVQKIKSRRLYFKILKFFEDDRNKEEEFSLEQNLVKRNAHFEDDFNAISEPKLDEKALLDLKNTVFQEDLSSSTSSTDDDKKPYGLKNNVYRSFPRPPRYLEIKEMTLQERIVVDYEVFPDKLPLLNFRKNAMLMIAYVEIR